MEIAHRIVLSFVALSACFLTGCGPAFGGKLYVLESLDSCPDNLEDALAPVHTDINRSSMSQLSCALSAIRGMKPPLAAASLQASQLCSVLAESSPEGDAGTARRHSIAREGVAWAEYAMATGALLEPESSYYYAVNLGLAVSDTIMKAMRSLGKLHKHMVRALKMDPDIDFGGPRRLLGYFLTRAPGWPMGPGDPDRGMELLEEAVVLFPDYPLNHLYHAKGLWEAQEDAEAALDQIEQTIDLLKAENWGIRRYVWIKDIRKLAEDIVGPEKAATIMARLNGTDQSINK